MKRVLRFWKILLFDLVAVALMIIAILTGPIPGPGGIPLFIIGLSILAVHHEWAQDIIDWLKERLEDAGKIIFTDDKDVQLGYDIACPPMVAGGAYLLWLHNAFWQIGAGLLLIITGLTLLAGNRNRWKNFVKKFKKKP